MRLPKIELVLSGTDRIELVVDGGLRGVIEYATDECGEVCSTFVVWDLPPYKDLLREVCRLLIPED